MTISSFRPLLPLTHAKEILLFQKPFMLQYHSFDSASDECLGFFKTNRFTHHSCARQRRPNTPECRCSVRWRGGRCDWSKGSHYTEFPLQQQNNLIIYCQIDGRWGQNQTITCVTFCTSLCTHHSVWGLHRSHPGSRHHHHTPSVLVYSDLSDTGSCWPHRYVGPLRNKQEYQKIRFGGILCFLH